MSAPKTTPKAMADAYRQIQELLLWVHENCKDAPMKQAIRYLVTEDIPQEIDFWQLEANKEDQDKN